MPSSTLLMRREDYQQPTRSVCTRSSSAGHVRPSSAYPSRARPAISVSTSYSSLLPRPASGSPAYTRAPPPTAPSQVQRPVADSVAARPDSPPLGEGYPVSPDTPLGLSGSYSLSRPASAASDTSFTYQPPAPRKTLSRPSTAHGRPSTAQPRPSTPMGNGTGNGLGDSAPNGRAFDEATAAADPEPPRSARPHAVCSKCKGLYTHLGHPSTSRPTAGSYYKFLVKGDHTEHGNKQNRYMDFNFRTNCAWDKDEKNLDVSALSATGDYQRMYYTWSQQRQGASADMQYEETEWAHFQAKDHISLEGFASWAAAIHPRTVHDFKPMSVMLQGVVRVLMEDKLKFFSEELASLQARLNEALDLISQLDAENGTLRKSLQAFQGKRVSQAFSSITAARRQALETAAAVSDATKASLRAREEDRARHRKEIEDLKAQMARQAQQHKDMIEKLKHENVGVKDDLQAQGKQSKRLRDKVKELMDELKAKAHYRDPAEVLKEAIHPPDDFGGLKMLFGEEGGAWMFISSVEEMRDLIGFACSHIKDKYKLQCEVTRIGYDPNMDLDDDGEDDPNTYDDNVMEVICSMRGRDMGDLLLRDDAGILYDCANERKVVTEDMMTTAAICMYPEHGDVGEVWGCVQGYPCTSGSKEAQVVEMFAEGLARAMRHLQELAEEDLRRAIATVGGITNASRWRKMQRYTKTGRMVMLGMGRRDGKMTEVKKDEDPAQTETAQNMELLRTAHENLVDLQRARNEIDKMLSNEQMRQALMQIKSYRRPPATAVEIMLALFTNLGHTSLWEAVTSPVSEKDDTRILKEEGIQKCWKDIVKRIKVEQLLKHMQAFEPGNNLAQGPYAEIQKTTKINQDTGEEEEVIINITEARNKTVAHTLKGIKRAEAKYVSLAAGLLYEWITVTNRIRENLQTQRELQTKLGVERLQNDWFDSKTKAE